MGPITKELVGVLSELILLLEGENEKRWSAWLMRSKSRIEHSDYSGIELTLSAYGGMGSFNDYIITGNLKSNEKLNALRSKAWKLAEEIKRSQ